MSYPWWRFEVTFFDGFSQEFSATGLIPTEAMCELLNTFLEDPRNSALNEAMGAHGDVVCIRYLHSDTFGIDAASDAILLREAGMAGELSA